jgi:TRAP-type C4-dicarboxylate transport system substrate-binding protein
MKTRLLTVIGVTFLIAFFFSLRVDAADGVKPIELRFSTFLSLDHTSYVNGWLPFAQELERKSNGRVKITFYPSEALGKAKDHYNMAVTGIADLSMSILGYNPGRFPLAEVLELPIVWPSATIGSRVSWEIYEKYLKKEFSDVKLLAIATTDASHIMTCKKPVKSLADLNGLRLRTGSPRMVDMIRAWGGSPMNVPIFDTYDALQKGMLDGVFTNYSSLGDFKLQEQLNHYTDVGMGAAVITGIMNLKAWNSLPPDIQKIVDELAGSRQSIRLGGIFDKSSKDALEAGVKRGGKVYTLSNADRAVIAAKNKPIIDAWIANLESKGLPGKKIYEDTIALVEKYSKEEASVGTRKK